MADEPKDANTVIPVQVNIDGRVVAETVVHHVRQRSADRADAEQAEAELRAKYDQADRDKMAGKEAMSDGSYPIKDAQDLSNAIRAVGRGGGSHNAIRAHIIARAKALGLSSKIPDNWGADGSMRAGDDLEERADTKECPTCDGTGKIMDGNRDCPDCDGTGQVARSEDSELEARQRRAESLKGTLEHRSFSVEGLEVRSLDDGTIRMSGYASVTETPYRVGRFTETIKRGAFKRTLSENPHVVLLFGHDGMPYASTKNGTLALTEDARGLHWTADLDGQDPDSSVLARKVGSGLIDECSFAFQATDQDWNADCSERSIKTVSIHKGDVSLVVAGANPETSVSMRVALEALEMRAGKKLSAATKAEIQEVVDVVDKLRVLLADPAPEPVADDAESSTQTVSAVIRYVPDMAARHRLRLMARNGGHR